MKKYTPDNAQDSYTSNVFLREFSNSAFPLVSVVMSVYNENPIYLEEAIKSILSQTYSNIEFIIIDDGCNETCKSVIIHYKDSDFRIKIITNETNIGLTKSLNKGIKVSQGKYIARMDSDDFSFPKRIELQVQYMEKHDDVIVLGTDTCDFNCRKLYSMSRTNDFEIRNIRMLFSNAGVYHPTAMIRKSFLDMHQIKYDENYIVAQDYRLWIDIIMHNGKIFTLRKILLKYRVHNNQISSKKHDLQVYYTKEIQHVYFMFLTGDKFTHDIEQEVYGLITRSVPKFIGNSLKNLCYFINVIQEKNKKAKQEFLLQYLLRGFSYIKHLKYISPMYFFNRFCLQIFFPNNIIYVLRYILFDRYS